MKSLLVVRSDFIERVTSYFKPIRRYILASDLFEENNIINTYLRLKMCLV